MLRDDDELVNADAEPPAGDFYVTIRRGSRAGALLGPYQDARDALAHRDQGRTLAELADPWTHFDGIGVSRVAIGTRVRAAFGR